MLLSHFPQISGAFGTQFGYKNVAQNHMKENKSLGKQECPRTHAEMMGLFSELHVLKYVENVFPSKDLETFTLELLEVKPTSVPWKDKALVF